MSRRACELIAFSFSPLAPMMIGFWFALSTSIAT
jgi:hypothetical protein